MDDDHFLRFHEPRGDGHGPLSRVTVYGYDATGNLIKITDPMSQISSIAYHALNRPTVVTAPLTGSSNAVTTTEVIIGDD